MSSIVDERGLYLDYSTDMPSGILRTEDDVLNYMPNGRWTMRRNVKERDPSYD